jgi:hypothetical protein
VAGATYAECLEFIAARLTLQADEFNVEDKGRVRRDDFPKSTRTLTETSELKGGKGNHGI